MTSHEAEPVVTPVFTMIGSATVAACEGDSCAIVVEPQSEPEI